MEYWGPHSHTATMYRIRAEDLEDATRDGALVSVMGHDVVRWDAADPARGWTRVADAQPCEVPLFALYQIFNEALPACLRSP